MSTTTTSNHSEWLALIDISGPFLSLATLNDIFPTGLPKDDADVRRTLRQAYSEWNSATKDELDRAWVLHIVRDVLGWPADLIVTDQQIPQTVYIASPDNSETLHPDFVLMNPATHATAPHQPRILIQTYLRTQRVDRDVPRHRWVASPATRMQTLLAATGVRLGIVTNGEQWMLVAAQPKQATTYVTWYATNWFDEPITLRAWVNLVQPRRLVGVPANETLEALLERSLNDVAEVTTTLGEQVRRAVELLVRDIDRIDQDYQGTLLKSLTEATLYEAALTVMMRLVILFCAEERGLLPDTDLYTDNYAIATMGAQLQNSADKDSEEILEHRHDAWARLLATFRLVFGGSSHDQLLLRAYGGHLFDPDRFPFLEGRATGTTWLIDPAEPLPITNRTVLHLLKALQWLQLSVGKHSEPHRLSFRALDVEQIGHVYEGLLDHTVVRATSVLLPLQASKSKTHPDVLLTDLLSAQAQGHESLLALLVERTGRAIGSITKDLASPLTAYEESHLQAACHNDITLYNQIRPFAALLRQDFTNSPIIIHTRDLYVAAGEDRRSSGTHYTPKSLTEPIVKHTLDPLVYHGPAEGVPEPQWVLRSASEILALTVCDMAMGSGAFLVQAARYLADHLVEAWQLQERAYQPESTNVKSDVIASDVLTQLQAELADRAASTSLTTLTAPYAALSRGELTEELLQADAASRRALALRLVAGRCLYGVDKNPMATEMAKLSLWLITLDKDAPFTFLDHALRHGDSLLGIHHPDQLLLWSLEMNENRQTVIFQEQIRVAIAKATALRRQIATRTDRDISDVKEKARLLQAADDAMDLAVLGADLLVGITLSSDAKDRASLMKDTLARYSVVMDAASTQQVERFTEVSRQVAVSERIDLRADADLLLQGNHPFHWALQFPEVFAAETPGFSALLGNPPFMGGQKITGNLGVSYRDYIIAQLAGGKTGSADLCAYFFLRAAHLLGPTANAGLLATNTIAQGDTREVGLDRLMNAQITINRAIPSEPWPGTAALEVAHVWLRRGHWAGAIFLDEKPVAGITSFLTIPGAVAGTPFRLAANAEKSFIGSYVLGMGFTLTPEEAQTLIAKDPRNAAVLFPYLNGEDINSRPDQSPSRWIINFHDWPLERAEEYFDCMAIVREKVKPERENNLITSRKEKWWHYAAPAHTLYTTIAGMERVLVIALTSNTGAFTFRPTNTVFSHATGVFAFENYSTFALLQSLFHTEWARQQGSSMKQDLRYTPTDCFATFPFPPTMDGLEEIGERYYAHRQSIMLERQQGLTKTYNRFHDADELTPDIVTLRQLHVEMDESVAAAYGWTDVVLGHGFHTTKQGVRYTISEAARREVLGRLLQLNHERYAEEVAAGLHAKGAKHGAGVRKAGNKARSAKVALQGSGSLTATASLWEVTDNFREDDLPEESEES